MTNFSRPALRYPGSKWTLSKWIANYLPKTNSIVDLFLGAGGMWNHLPRYPLETAVEVDGEITNFFQQLRTNKEALIEAINWTLWSQKELALCYQPCEDDLECARRTYVRSAMSIGGIERHRNGYRLIKKYEKHCHIPAKSELIILDHLYEVAERFRGVQILNTSAFKVLPKFLNQPSTLIYADPPYLLGTRHRKYYKHEFTDEHHAQLASLLKKHDGPVVISGKPHPYYKDWYEDAGWHVVQKTSRSQTGKKDQVETLWINSACQQMIQAQKGVQARLLNHD